MLRLSSTSLDELQGLLLTKVLFMTRRKKKHLYQAKLNISKPFLCSLSRHFFLHHHMLLLLKTSHFITVFSTNKIEARTINSLIIKATKAIIVAINYNSSFNRGQNHNFHGSSYFGQRISCQICGNTSHEVIDCFDRMNPEILGKIPHTKLAVMYAHYSSKPSPLWLLDSGASSHITNEISNIASPSLYNGEDKV